MWFLLTFLVRRNTWTLVTGDGDRRDSFFLDTSDLDDREEDDALDDAEEADEADEADDEDDEDDLDTDDDIEEADEPADDDDERDPDLDLLSERRRWVLRAILQVMYFSCFSLIV